MKITLKLYAMLGQYLPENANANVAEVLLDGQKSVTDVLNHFAVPLEHCHLVLVNGNYVEPSARDQRLLEEDDHLAVWPPVAGG